MRRFKLPERDQDYLLMNVNLNSIAPTGSALHSLDRLIDVLDTSNIEKKYDLDSTRGNIALHPKTYIKVALWALHNCRFSLRKIEEDTANNLGYKWLTGNEVIDHSTMGKFLAVNAIELEGMFSQVVTIGIKKGLIDFDILAADTVKLRASASYKQFRDKEGIRKEKRKIRERIKALLEKTKDERTESEQEERQVLQERDKRLDEAMQELTEREKERKTEGLKINITDFDCQHVQQGNGETNAGYPITMTADGKTDFITGYRLDEEGNDSKILFPALAESEKNCKKQHKTVVADSGFSSMENLERIEKEDIDALIPDRRMEVEERGETAKGKYDRSNFKYDQRKDRYRCPEGVWLANIGKAEQNGRQYKRYANRAACTGCLQLHKCTKSGYRTVSRDINEHLKEEMRKKLSKKRRKEQYNKRAHIAETPFGHMKHNLKYRSVMRRGKHKIGMEFSLLCILHNLFKIAKLEFGYGTG